jgi:hypothetical protein
MNDLIITAMSKCHEYDGPDFVPERESLAATVSRTPDPNKRITKKKNVAAYCVAGPKRCFRNS